MTIKTVEVRVTSRIRSVELGGGLPGPIGVSITGGTVNGSGHLILTLSNGGTIDAGYIVGPPGPISSLTETGNGIIIDNTDPSDPVLSLDATLEAVANFTTGANKVMVWSGTDTLTSFDVDTDVTLAANSDTRFATQKAVKAYADALIAANDAMVFKGVIDASANPNYPAADRGHTWRISVAGKIGGASGTNVEVGDLIICLTDGSAAGTQAAVGANWTVSQTNLDGAVIGPAISTDAAIAGFNGTTGKLIKVLTATEIRAAAVLATTDTPQFAGLNIGHATDTTVTRHAAGVLAVEGVQILNASGAQVVADKDLVDSTTDIIGNVDATKRSGFANDLIATGQRRVLTIPDKNGVIVTDPLAVTDVLPTLDLRLTHFDGAPFDDFFSRSGAGGYRMNAKGVMVPTVDREPVIDFGSDGKPLGAGFYGAYTNLLLRSEEFDNASWSKTGTTVTVNAVAGPDGLTTIDKIVEDSSTGSHIAIQSVTLANGSVFTASVTLKAAERTFVRIRLGDSGFVGDAVIDLSTGMIASGTGVSSVVSLGNGFYRVSVTGTVVAGNIASVQVTLRQSSSVESYTGDGASGLYVGQASITATAFPVPYVPTTSAAVARVADSMVITGTDFTDFFNPVEGTFFADFEGPRVVAGEFPSLVEFGTALDRISLLAGGDDQTIRLAVRTGGTFVTDLRSSFTAGTFYKAAVRYKANDFALSFNGNATLTDVAGALPSVSLMTIGDTSGGVTRVRSCIRRLTYWPKALSAAQLERMTA